MSDFVNGVCFDWFEFTTHRDTVKSIIDVLGLGEYEFLETYGSDGYKRGLMFEKIFIFYEGLEGMGIHIRMSGQACRSFEKYSSLSENSISEKWNKLIKYIVENSEDVKLSRLDVAYDDFNGLLNIEKIVNDVDNRNFVTRFRSNPEVIYQVNEDCEKSYSVNFGRKSSNTFLRFYDKLKERDSKDIVVEGCTHWVRAEFMFRKSNANRFIELYNDGKPIEELYFLVMNNYLRFVKPSGSDSNRWRWELAEHWDKFCNSVISDKISLYVAPAESYDSFKLTNYVTCQAGAAVYTYIQKFGINDLMEKVEPKKYKLALKYRELLTDEEEQKYDNVFDSIISSIDDSINAIQTARNKKIYTCLFCNIQSSDDDFISYSTKTADGMCRTCYYEILKKKDV